MTNSRIPLSQNAKNKIAEFESLPRDQQSGDYWNTDDKDIQEIRSKFKRYYQKHQDYRCAYCQQRNVVDHGMAWDIEHIIPRINYPWFMFVEDNLCLSCKDCNGRKRAAEVHRNKNAKTLPIKSENYFIVHPHFDSYTEHIEIIKEAGFYLPKTPKGMATVEMCGLLRFVFQFASYEATTENAKARLALLNDQFQRASDPLAIHFILSCIRKFADETQSLLTAEIEQRLA